MQPNLHLSFQKYLKYGRNDAYQLKITESYVKNVVINAEHLFVRWSKRNFAFMNDVDLKWILCGQKWISQTKTSTIVCIGEGTLDFKVVAGD